MKKLSIILLLALSIGNIKAQEFTHLADSATSEIILRKYVKWNFAREICVYKDKSIIPKNYFLGDSNSKDYGNKSLHERTYAIGKWAMKPDYKIYKSYYKSPWKGYELYQMDIPKHSPRNDSITAYFTFRDFPKGKDYMSPDYFSCPIASQEIVVYNPKTDDWKLANPRWRMPLTKQNEDRALEKVNPQYKISFDDEKKSISLLKPENDEQIEQMLKSELMKNIYSYRFFITGLADSLTDGRYLKEDKTLFPLLDSLLPDFDEDLLMYSESKVRTGQYLVWRFYYPGEDILTKGGQINYRKSLAWEKYFKLEPAHYVVAYEPKRQLVHFIAGKNIFLTRFSPCCFPCADCICDLPPKLDSADHAERRNELLRYRLLDVFIERYGAELSFLKEDDNYWYYQAYTEIPIMKLFITDEILKEGEPPIFVFTNPNHLQKKCNFKVRISKKNLEIIDIEVINCKEEKRTLPDPR